MYITAFGTVTLSRLPHPLNTFAPMLVTLLGMLISFKLPHPLNALTPILSTPFGIVKLTIPHPLNALAPILVIPIGIIMLSTLLQPEKAFAGIVAPPNTSMLVSDVGSILSKRYADFDVRNYSFKKMVPFLKSMGLFEVRKDPDPKSPNSQIAYVRLKEEK